MSNASTPLRPAMTAIAAFIALSSTPLMAQAVDTSATPAAPAAPVAVDVPAAPVAVESSAPVTVAPAAPMVTPAPAPAPIKMVGTPVEHTEDSSAAAESTAAPRTGRATPTKTVAAPVTRSTATTVTRTAEIPAAPVAAKPITPTPEIAPVAKATPAAPAAPTPAKVAQTTSVQRSDDNTAPIAGAIGLGLLAVGGAAFALGRRKRDEDELDTVYASADDEVIAPMAVATPAPIIAAREEFAPAPSPAARINTPRTLPNGFDISRFGRHTQAAYLGPTPNNPSHSLRRRLKHASFFDQREREAAEAGIAAKPAAREPVYATAAKTQTADDGQITVRMAPQRSTSRFGYVVQR